MQRDKIQSKKIQMKENKTIPKNRLDITQSIIIHMKQNTKMIIYKKDKIQNDKNKDSKMQILISEMLGLAFQQKVNGHY